MVVTGFYMDINKLYVQAPIRGGNPYRGLAAAVVLQAIKDWEWCCKRCADGKDFSNADCNFYELEGFFCNIAPIYVDEIIDTDAMLQTLLDHKADAFRTRQRKGISYYGADLRKAREGKGITRRQLAELTGYSIKQIERWESGIEPKLKQRFKLTETIKRLP